MRERPATAHSADRQASVCELEGQIPSRSLIDRFIRRHFDSRKTHGFDQRQVAAPFGPRRHLAELVPGTRVKHAPPQRIAQLHEGYGSSLWSNEAATLQPYALAADRDRRAVGGVEAADQVAGQA